MTEEEARQELVYYLAGRCGSFMTKLIGAIMAADNENSFKLALGFPNLVNVIRKYQNVPGYYEDYIKPLEK
jgi:hypothetical protein